MSRNGILLLAGLFALAFLLLEVGKCGYTKIDSIKTIENAIAQVRSDFPKVKPVQGKTLQLYRQSSMKFLIVDARGQEEYEVSHLPGAKQFETVKEVEAYLSTAEQKLDAVVVYGSLGFRSAEFSENLQKEGISNVEHLEGGIFKWANDGLPLVTGDGESASLVHQYNRMWGRLLKEELRLPLTE